MQQSVGAAGRHHNQAALSTNQMLVLHQRIHHSAVNLHSGQALPCKLQRYFFTSSQSNRSFFGNDHTLIADLGRQQCNVTAQ